MPCGKGWSAIKDPTKRAKARRAYYARKKRDLDGMKAAAAQARREFRAEKHARASERRRRAAGLRGKRATSGKTRRSPF